MADTPELYSVNQFPGDGVQNQFELTFADGYLRQEDVLARVYADAELSSYTEPTITFVGTYQVQLSPTPAAGTIVRIYRQTQITEPLVDFSDGSIINEANLDTNARQAVMLAQETRDAFGLSAEIDGIPALINDLEEALDDLEDAFDSPAFTGSPVATGFRPITLNPALGQVTIKGDAASWATGYSFVGSGGAYLGSFGGYGAGNGVNWLYMGYNFEGDNSLRVYPSGLITWGVNPLTPSVATRTELKAFTAYAGRVANLTEAGREGSFICRAGSAPVSDTLEGIYVVSDTASYYWERVWDKINGYPEWFGAITENASFASTNVTALNAAHVLVPVLNLRAGRYYVNATVEFATANHKVLGVGYSAFNDGDPAVSAIINTTANTTTVRIGPASQPGPNPVYFPQGIHVEDIFVGRSVAPNIASDCVGVLAQFLLSATIRNIKSHNSMVGYRLAGLVGTIVDRTYTTRDVAGAGGGTDYWTGYDIYGFYNIGTVGGNASLFIEKANAACNYGPLQTAPGCRAYYLRGSNQDMFISDVESNTCATGMFVEGGAGPGADLYINHPIMDACYLYGIIITNALASDAINFTDPYIAMQGGNAAFDVANSSAAISVNGGQILMGPASARAIQLETTTKNVTIKNTLVQANAASNVVTLGDVQSCVLEPIIVNNSGSDSGFNAIVAFGAVVACRFAPTVAGNNKFIAGIQIVGTADVRTTYDVGGINSANITVGYANKLVRNGSTALSSATMVPTYVGTNLVTGATG